MGGQLADKVAVITGGCSGIGLASVERFVAEGALIAVGDIQDEKGEGLQSRFPGRVLYRHCDVTDVHQIKALIDDAAHQFGGLDIVFNNAGAAGSVGAIDEVSMPAWDRTFDLLVRSVAAGTQYAIPHMEARGGGSIINTASIAGLQAGWGPTAYSTAKAAVAHFSKCAAMDVAQRKIRVNAICPGLIATSIFGDAFGLDRAQSDQMAARIEMEVGPLMQALPVSGAPSAIANMALFLACDDSYFVTGQALVVDGGITAGHPHSWQRGSGGLGAALLGLTDEEAQERYKDLLRQQAALDAQEG
ncbi:MAG: SDR family NAD(P)-dependent oxidoreductase [Alphaproteobacteria bacterium]